MAIQTRTERNAVNEVRNFIDGTSCLRSYLQENDKTPLWDGTVFVYHGEPDKNENLVGTIRTQVKGTEVGHFKPIEDYRFTPTELNLYMLEGGQVFFVVEMLKSNVRERKIFYKKLTPHFIKSLLKQHKGHKTIQIKLLSLPADERLFEDEMQNFVADARKQVSFSTQKELSLTEALGGGFPLKAEGVFNGQLQSSLALLVTSQPFTLYQETPHASIPISDVELTARATEHFKEPVSVDGRVYFQEHARIYNLKSITEDIGGCLFFTYPKPGYGHEEGSQIEIRFPQKGPIAEAIHVLEFLKAVKEKRSIAFGDKEYPLHFTDDDNENLFKDVQYTYDLYRDIEALWQSMQIPGTFSFDDFDDKGLQQYLNVVLYVHRGMPGIPDGDMKGEKSYFSMLPVGKLHLLIHFTHLHDQYYSSKDAFSSPCIINNGKRFPLLSLVLAKEPHLLPDNLHHTEQIEAYRQCMGESPKFTDVIEHDLSELKKRMLYVENEEKRVRLDTFMKDLEKLLVKHHTTP